jgi:hypothetical protein
MLEAIERMERALAVMKEIEAHRIDFNDPTGWPQPRNARELSA